MKNFTIDFSSVSVEAETEEEAKKKGEELLKDGFIGICGIEEDTN